MSLTKRLMEQKQELHEAAIAPALEAGAVEKCEFHGTIITTYDDDALKLAYAIGTKMWKRGEIGGERAEFMDAIKSVVEESAMECWQCERWETD